jgi:chorismate mutase / prephenate dehydratase
LSVESYQILVSFQGEHGAYSEQAAYDFFGESIKTKPCAALKDVFREVEERPVSFGVVPAENSLEGTITQTYDLLLQSPLQISGEIKIKISHCLLGLPGTNLKDISKVYSHPQALAQCRRFLEDLHVTVEPAYDTAGSAKMIMERGLRGAAAIAGERAGALYGLDMVRREIEDDPENYTRFFVVGKDDAPPTGKDKTSIVFGTKHSPGSLHRALNELAIRGINLTKIESRPIRGTPWEYHFFVDFEGHRSDQSCADALRGLARSVTFVKVLGSYPRTA